MIRNKTILGAFMFVLAVHGFYSCTGNFEDINKDPNGVTDEELAREGYNIGASLVGLQSYVISTQEHLHQFFEVLAGGSFSGYLSDCLEAGTSFSKYNPPVDWERAPFNTTLSKIYPYYQQLRAVTDDEVVLALGDLFRIASMHRITDTYGPIPYSKMIASSDSGDDDGPDDALTSAYDSQETVYSTMFTELDNVISTLTKNANSSGAGFAAFDNVYSGNITNWVKFANSLKLRMAIRLAYVNETLARQKAEEAVSHTVGVIIDNSEIAELSIKANPLELQVVQWSDTRASADIVSFMKGYSDPRLAVYFRESTFIGGTANGFHGLRSGITPTKSIAVTYSAPIVTTTTPIMWMNAAEVAFLKAEGALRGWTMGGTAEDLYNEGISLSFSQHGASGAATYMNDGASVPARYIDPLGTYSYTGTTSTITIKWDAGATFEKNLERVITQKWIANFPLSIEAWSEFRRTGYPKLMTVVSNLSGGIIPANEFIKRLQYPDTEYSENLANVKEAVSYLGGADTRNTKLWWDKK